VNGDIGKVYKVVNEIKVHIEGIRVRQEERHIETTKKFDTIFNKLEDVKGVTDLKDDLNRMQWIIFVVVVLGIWMKLT